MTEEDNMEILKDQPCPFCREKKLTLMQKEMDIPYFGIAFIFSMDCTACNYHKSDIEAGEMKDPSKYTLEVSSEEDMKIRIVKSGEATIKIPHVTTITPGPASNGYVTNVEGILNRVKKQIEDVKEGEDDPAAKKKAKNLLKKLQKVIWGQEKLKITIEDPTGNSAIISEKAVKGKL
jgi:zinc finger protein